jgi:hypothetical protein
MDWRARYRKITASRLRSELWALDLAFRVKPLSIFPIFATVGFWWFAAALFALVPGLVGMVLWQLDTGPLRLFGGALHLAASVGALILLCLAAPWFFRWYFIAVTLMLGRPAMAERKRAALLAAIAADRAG